MIMLESSEGGGREGRNLLREGGRNSVRPPPSCPSLNYKNGRDQCINYINMIPWGGGRREGLIVN